MGEVLVIRNLPLVIVAPNFTYASIQNRLKFKSPKHFSSNTLEQSHFLDSASLLC